MKYSLEYQCLFGLESFYLFIYFVFVLLLFVVIVAIFQRKKATTKSVLFPVSLLDYRLSKGLNKKKGLYVCVNT